MQTPLVTVVILNWNGKQYLSSCLESVFKQIYPRLKVIVVDNGSRDGSVQFIEEKYPDSVILIRNEENLGFAEGNNQGIKAARGKYVALLNNDTRVEPRWLREMVRVMEENPEAGMCSSKILCARKPHLIDNAGFLIYRDGTVRSRGRLEAERGQYDREEEILAASGCALIYRRKMLDEIGLFDPDFFAYGDDCELGLRARLAGWKAIFVPRSIVYHIGSATAGAYSPLKAFSVERNRIWLTIKYFPLPQLCLSPIFTLLRFFFQAYAAFSHRGTAGMFARQHSRLALLKVLCKAYWEAGKKLPRMWEKRKAVRFLKKVNDREVRSWFRKFGISVRELTLRE